MASKLNITRRDFLNGVALSLAAGTSLSPLEVLAKATSTPRYYPPALTGLRGSHVGSFEIAHAVAMAGANFGYPAEQTDATYDLVVVGGGLSGLSAAQLYRERAGEDRKILVLDNHDDFGGHAKRNEFSVDGKSLIGYGGSQAIEAPGLYSRQSAQLLHRLGIDTSRFYDYFDADFFENQGLGPAIYFSQEAYGKDVTLPNAMGDWMGDMDPALLETTIADYPLSDESKASLAALLQGREDHLAGLRPGEKTALLRSISYSDFLRKHVGATEEVVTMIRDTIKGYWGIGWDALSALEAYRLEQPGTRGLGIETGLDEKWTSEEPYIFHFPDGNAGIARALVRNLIPDAVPGSTMEDLVTARADYGLLDLPANSTRIRLSATAVNVRHTPDQSAVDVTYLGNGKPQRVRARHVILACYNQVIPHIVPEVPTAQRKAIEHATKIPLVYVSIAVRNWRAFANLGCHSIYVPNASLMHSFGLDFPVSMGKYAFTAGPDDATVLHGTFVPTAPDQGLSQQQQNRLGQKRLYEMSFDDYETEILHQLDGALACGGFDAERDIAALTVNRWPHGYAYEYNDLFEPVGFGRDAGPHIQGRAQIGRISIANSDAEASAYVDGAIDAAVRAVNEQLAWEA
ncbi:MAG: NAD(P)-binding protein [Gammaproteobacteria bacterium]|nr:NAD(P)-binding protein [Gammaproteobacteria bacterium]MDH3434211.1 NAD(P)-binding protein [Gammaproteobacteria bacterium]